MKLTSLRLLLPFIILVILSITIASATYASPPVITLTKDNTVSFVGEVTGESVSELILNIETMKSKDVYIYIQSPGGSVLDGQVFLDYLKTTDKNISCIGKVAISMAHHFFEACPTRLITHNSILMQHNMQAGVGGKVETMKRFLGLLRSVEKELDQQEADRLHMTFEHFEQVIKDEWWVYGTDALHLQLADREVVVKCASELYNTHRIKAVQTFFGPLNVEFNGCPLINPKLASDAKSETNPITNMEIQKRFNTQFAITPFILKE